MKLVGLKLINFRGYKEQTYIRFEKGITAFIGKNDIGKSTILEALEIFFNNKSVKLESNDKCVSSETSDKVYIGCVFEEIPDNIVIDAENETCLRDEFLLNKEGQLEIVKEFDCEKAKPSETVYIYANFPNHESYKDILEKTNADLKKLAKGLEVSDNRKNAELRKAIRENISAEHLELEEQFVSLKKGDSKSIWDKISMQLPLFALFRSDRASSDQDNEVQDPMKLAVDIALREVQDKLDEIKEAVQAQAIEVAQRTLKKLEDMDSELAKELTPQFKEDPKWNGIFKLSLNSEKDIPINKRGSGVRRLILLNFFRAEAERIKNEKGVIDIILAIEEPETSQHPNNQELILESLKEISENSNYQVVLTTHVPSLAALIPLSSLRFISLSQDKKRIVNNEPDDNVLSEIANSLGILPYDDASKAKAIVMVEGHGDVIFLNHASKVLKEYGTIPFSLEEKGIVPIITGGCTNLRHWVNLKLIEALGKPYCVLLDSDKTKEEDIPCEKNVKIVRELREEKGITVLITKKREIENYLSPRIIPEIDVIDNYSDIKTKTKSGKKVFEIYWPNMTAEDILDCDKYTDQYGYEKHEIVDIINSILSLH